ncbi:MAG: phosphotransferase family protein [Acidimicrobiales bacterium]
MTFDPAESESINSELIDIDCLVKWLDSRGLEMAQPIRITALTSGRSNAMFVIDRGTSSWVLRRPALVAIDRANEGMAREYRILDALKGFPIPHPETVALCEDHGVLGCTFFLMQKVDGFNPSPPLPPPFTVEDQPGVLFAMIDAMASLHDFDWRNNGLGDLGRFEGFHERQVDRWRSQLASYGGREFPNLEQVTGYLSAALPSAFEPSLMHGDFHMFNLLLAPEPPGRVTAILDWETATIGDPLLDLTGFCEIMSNVIGSDDWPTRDELIRRYCTQREIEVPTDLAYYEALYNFRMAVLLEGIYQRSLSDTTRPKLVEVGERAMGFHRRALEVVSGR